MDSATKSNCIALVVVLVAVIIVVAIVWCARYCGGNNNKGDCGWSGGSSGGDCSDDDDCDSPRSTRSCPPKNSNTNWCVWAAVIIGVLVLVILICVVIWRCFFCKKSKPSVDTTYVVSEEPCDRQKTNVTFVHDPPPVREERVAVAGVCDDTGDCVVVTTATNLKQGGPVVTSYNSGGILRQRTDLEKVLGGGQVLV